MVRQDSLDSINIFSCKLVVNITVNEVFAAVQHLLLPRLAGENLETVLSFLGHLDVHQKILFVLDPVPRVPLLRVPFSIERSVMAVDATFLLTPETNGTKGCCLC